MPQANNSPTVVRVAQLVGDITLVQLVGAGLAPLDSPGFTGTPTALNPLSSDNSTRLATTAFVKAQGYLTTNAVTSVFGRVGAVVASSGDYTASQVTGAVVATGVSGGQTVNGGTGASEALTLVSTTHGTKGRVNLGSTSSYVDATGIFTANRYSFANGASIAGTSGTTTFNPPSVDPNWGFNAAGGGNRVVQIDGISTSSTLLFVTMLGNQSIFRVEPAGQTRAIARTTSISPLAVEAMSGQTAPLQALRGISSTGTLRDVGYLDAGFVVSTDASRTGHVSLSAVDFSGTRQGLKVSSDGTQALIGFYGATPVAKAAAPTTLGDVITILRNLGLCS